MDVSGRNITSLDCDDLTNNPELLGNMGYMMVIRAVFDNEPLDVELEEEVRSLKMKVLYLDDVVQVKDEKRKEAYIAALEQILYKRESLEGNDWSSGTRRIAFYDIDRDGNEELMIDHDDGSLAGTKLYIYDYDEESGTVQNEFCAWPSLTFYENGVIEAWYSHYNGTANGAEDFWPYILYKYNKATDIYERIADVDGWYNAENVRPAYEGGLRFPTEADADGDGIVYYINTGDGSTLKTTPVDNDAYNAWRDSVIGDSKEINFDAIQFITLPSVGPIPAG